MVFVALITCSGIAVAFFCLWYIFCVNFVDIHEFGFVYSRFTGRVTPVAHSGWVVVWPWADAVHKIDLRPHQVQITAGSSSRGLNRSDNINRRVLNAKLVRFDPKGIETFIKWHGRDAGDDVDNLLEILKVYAFDRDEGKDCPFLIIENELSAKHTQSVPDTKGQK